MQLQEDAAWRAASTGEHEVTEQWVAVGEDQWELRAENGKKLGSLVRLEPTDVAEGPTWIALPRGGQYLQPQAKLRAAAEALLDRARHLHPATSGQNGKRS